MPDNVIIKIRHKRHIFVGVIIFLMIFAYLCYHSVVFMTKDKPVVYTIGEENSFYQGKLFTGLIVRKEKAVKTDKSGYLSYYIPSSDRVSVEDIVYSVDETGDSIKLDDSGTDDPVRITELTGDITAFINDYRTSDFSSVYDLRCKLDSKLIMSKTKSKLDNFEQSASPSFHIFTSPETGIIEYYIDGYEEFDPAAISAADFDKSTYQKTQLNAREQVAEGEFAYKVITSDSWDIYIRLAEPDAAKLASRKTLKVLFPETGLETVVKFGLIKGSDDAYYGRLTLSKYMISYADTRYIKLELLDTDESGIIIPKSAEASQEFYTIPESYLGEGGNSSDKGFQKVEDTENGERVRFITPEIACTDNDICYVSVEDIAAGSVLQQPGTTERFVVNQTASLTGAYNINKGYAVFVPFYIISEEADYYLVGTYKGNTLKPYDKILLYPGTGSDGAFIY